MKLTDHQLTRLSAIVNGRAHGHGMALVALLNKGLVIERDRALWWHKKGRTNSCDATQTGIDALTQARAGGW